MDLATARSLRIGIISDTHGYFHPEIPAAFKDVDCILHAGDFGTEQIVDSLRELAPTFGVYGNIDGAMIRRMLSESVEVVLGGVKVWMTHIAGRPGRWSAGIPNQLRVRKPGLLVCGHSHILRIERMTSPISCLYLNPGAAGRQGFHQVKTCVILTVKDGVLSKADVIHLDELNSNGK